METSYRELLTELTGRVRIANINPVNGTPDVSDPVMLSDYAEVPIVTVGTTGDYVNYLGIVNKVNVDDGVFYIKEGTVIGGIILGAEDNDKLYLSLNGSITPDSSLTSLCIGRYTTENNGIILHEPINTIGINQYTMADNIIRDAIVSLLDALDARLSGLVTRTGGLLEQSVYDPRVAAWKNNAESVQTLASSLVEVYTNLRPRIRALEEAQSGTITVNLSHDVIRDVITVVGTTSDVPVGNTLTADYRGSDITTTVQNDRTFRFPDQNAEGIGTGVFSVTVSGVDKYNKDITGVGTTGLDNLRDFTAVDGNLSATFTLKDSGRTAVMDGWVTGVPAGISSMTMDIYDENLSTGRIATSSMPIVRGDLVDPDDPSLGYRGTFKLINIDVSRGTYAKLQARLRTLDFQGNLIIRTANKVYINSDNEYYNAEGTLGTFGDAFGLG